MAAGRSLDPGSDGRPSSLDDGGAVVDRPSGVVTAARMESAEPRGTSDAHLTVTKPEKKHLSCPSAGVSRRKYSTDVCT